MKPLTAIEQIGMYLVGISYWRRFSARDIERLGSYLGETYARELRRLRQMGIVHYTPTDKKGVYQLTVPRERERLQKWLKQKRDKREKQSLRPS